jgi:hypothetical protein
MPVIFPNLYVADSKFFELVHLFCLEMLKIVFPFGPKLSKIFSYKKPHFSRFSFQNASQLTLIEAIVASMHANWDDWNALDEETDAREKIND